MIQRVSILILIFLLFTGTIIAQTKVVLIEEATGTWCGWCPKGKVLGEQLLHDYEGEIIFIEVHGNDPMEDEKYKDASLFYAYPSGHVNRKENQFHVQPERWKNLLHKELDEVPPANVFVETAYDTSSRNLTVNISAEFFETLSGDYRFAAIVVEDAVMDDDESYAQKNFFANNTNGLMGGFEILPELIPADWMVYDHVGRHLLGGYNGESGSLPTEVLEGNTYTYSFDWILPNEYNKDYIWIAALLINHENGEIINAGRSIYISGNENTKPFFVSEPETKGHKDYPYLYNIRYHDSSDFNYEIEIVNPIPEWLNFEEIGTGFAELKGVPKDTGIYEISLRVRDAEYTIDQSFQIVVKDSIPPLVSRVNRDFLILPNPNNGIFNLEFDIGTHYQIFDSSGRKMKEGKLVRNIYDNFFIQPIDVSDLKSGLYFLQVFGSSGYVNTKKMLLSKN